jgi:alkylated DNA nucleotide flippase Atl1
LSGLAFNQSYHLSVCAGLALLTAVAVPGAQAADRLILRNLDFILDRTVVALDEDGATLDAPLADGTTQLSWDRIERGKVALDQARFDELLAEIGLPLFRVRQRLKSQDYAGLAAPAELLYAKFADRSSPAAINVAQATLWSRMALGRREAAVEPYLRVVRLLAGGKLSAEEIPGKRQLAVDLATGLSSELIPVWHDSAAAKQALAGAQQAIRDIAPPRPAGVYVYYATLALAAGEPAEAERVLPFITEDSPELAAWRRVILAQREVLAGGTPEAASQLADELATIPPTVRPAALYWVGRSRLLSSDDSIVRDGLLDLLSIPAEYPQVDAELAAAALYLAADQLDKVKDDEGAAAIRQEISRQYGHTQVANQRRTGDK